MILSIHAKKNNIKTREYQKFFIELKEDKIPVLEKADSASNVVDTTPEGLTKFDCDYHITGLNGDGPYWKIIHYGKDKIISGYIENKYLKE